LVKWESTNNDEVLQKVRKEILKSTDGNPPPVLAESILFPHFTGTNMRYIPGPC
jgi:hypothetical protein